MIYALMLLLGLAVGGAAGLAIGMLRARGLAEGQRSGLESRAVSAETRSAELERLGQLANQELAALRGQLQLAEVARAAADTRLEEANRSVAEQKQLLVDAQIRLVDVFKSLSADALRGNSEEFRRQAQQTLATVLEQARGDMGKREEAIKGLVEPLAKALNEFDQQVRQIETQRREAYGGLRQYLDSVSGGQQQLQAETRKLVAALNQPRVRGSWGELTLRRVAEAAGMSQHCDFAEQVSSAGEDGRVRPDMVIRLPGGRHIVVDAKAPMKAYLEALEATDENARQAALADHAKHVRSHMMQLAGKRYWDALPATPEMVVLFVPGESFFSAALECDRTLIEDGAAKRVVLASPTTLIALLRAVSYGWQQEAVAENAQKISDLGKQLYERICTWAEHLAGAGTGLRTAVNKFNAAVGSLERSVLPSARRFRDLGIVSTRDISEADIVDQIPRELPAELADRAALPELPELPGLAGLAEPES